ncbi:hypothetical protein [Bordetella bronchiseptica]|nr:hypothetical protein [Bordetella bronchiseptica]KAK64330.1 hypothetical protein AZ22_3687 [Bordetella bronchiseptica 980-2]
MSSHTNNFRGFSMRKIHEHKVDSFNELLDVHANDERTAGGAAYHYVIEVPGAPDTNIIFQNGDPKLVGPRGITMEALLAVLADRLRGFQGGAFPCHENANALLHVEAALAALKWRILRLSTDRQPADAACPNC